MAGYFLKSFLTMTPYMQVPRFGFEPPGDSNPELINLSIISVWGSVFLCHDGCPRSHRMLSSISGVHPKVAGSHLPPVVITKWVIGQCSLAPPCRQRLSPLGLRTTALGHRGQQDAYRPPQASPLEIFWRRSLSTAKPRGTHSAS